MTYDRLGHELDSDLITLCPKCHKQVTDLWHITNDGVKACYTFLKKLLPRYNYAKELASHLNTVMQYDISFGGKYVLTRLEDIEAACNEAGIECRFKQRIQKLFNHVHILDVSDQISNGVPKWKLKNDGYPAAIVDNITKRRGKIFGDSGLAISDEVLCYLHEGKGNWTVVAIEDGLDTQFNVRFIPAIRYADRWYDYA